VGLESNGNRACRQDTEFEIHIMLRHMAWGRCYTADQKGMERDEPRYNVGRKIPAHCASGANADRVAMVW